ncbi:MAG: sugar phosphate nucleotidyltransferase [Puniceicoccaceae bacterium]
MEQDYRINLFIASAGMGTRLQPLTHTFPKPLLPVAGIAVIDRLLQSINGVLEIESLAMNLHHLPEQFQQWTESLDEKVPQPKFFHEDELLGTGGAISNAHEFFCNGTCLLVNGDILADIDWRSFVEYHRQSSNMVTLAVQDRSHERRVGVDSEGKLLCIDPSMSTAGVHRWLGYACAAIYEPEFLEYLPQGESHVPPFWVTAAENTKRIGTYDIGLCAWLDLGNVDSYAWGILSCLKGSQRYLAEPLKIPWDTKLNGTCVIEQDVTIGLGVELIDSILLPGAIISDGEVLDSVVAGPGFRVPYALPQTHASSQSDNGILSGSDRLYRRTPDGMLMEYSATEKLVQRQIKLTGSLLTNGISVPEVLSNNPAKRQVLLQDLGDESLQVWCKGQEQNEILEMLQDVLDRLIDFQWADVADTGIPQDKPFDETVLLWETSYFLERCVYRVFGLKEFCDPILKSLQAEFEKLASTVSSLPRNLMHRDFQSSNVMIHDNKPWFIDFQAAHHGPCFYDAASMIGDPYLDLPKQARQELDAYYLAKVSSRLNMSSEDARTALIECGMQRHMQALGAYGFLSSIRGKQDFLQYITPALGLLSEEVELLKSEFPVLHKLVQQLRLSSSP